MAPPGAIPLLPMHYSDITQFWFQELDPKDWFRKDKALDQAITQRFGDTLVAAAACELSDWRREPAGRLAEILVLDQFSRNIFRDTPYAFSQDTLALALAQEAIRCNAHQALSQVERKFIYMPFMHSESKAIHETAVTLFSEPGMEDNLRFELRHKEIIDRFGRYPHRNAVLNRQSSAEETAFLKQPGSGF